MIWDCSQKCVSSHLTIRTTDAIDQSKDTPPTRPGNLIDVFMGSAKKSALQKNQINGFLAKEKLIEKET